MKDPFKKKKVVRVTKDNLKDFMPYLRTNGTSVRKSICTCGHIGDAPNSQHADFFNYGHGRCLVPGCSCQKFTWKGWA